MKSIPIRIEEPARPDITVKRFALWDLGFRPFYLLASVFSAVSIALWAAQFAGWLPHAYLSGSLWHAHEMLFGFTLAVIVGFLFTAARVWSGNDTPTGIPLMLLVILWLAARVLVVTPFGWLAAIANTAFPLIAGIALAIPLSRAGSRRNYLFVAVLLVLSILSLGVHAAQLGVVNLPPWVGVQIALDLVLLVMVLMAGRVIPAFSNNGVPGCHARRVAALDHLSVGLILALLIADTAQVSSPVLGVLLLAAALAHGIRLMLWNSYRTWRTPLVWILHVAYTWIVLHLLLRGLAAFDLINASIATHALAAGAIGSLTLGMMTRTTKGHTGLPLEADRFDISCFLLVLAAACVRVFVPLWWPAQLLSSVALAGCLWSAAFGLFAIRYWPVLSRPRRDGKPR